LDDAIESLFNVGLIRKDGKFLVKSDNYSEFFKLLKNSVRSSITRTIAWVIWYLYNTNGLECFKGSQILNELSDRSITLGINEDSVRRVLKRLKLEFKNNVWYLNDIALSKIEYCLKGKYSMFWPVILSIYVKGTKYFKIAHKISASMYVDFPIDIIYKYIGYLQEIDRDCTNLREFYEKAEELTNAYNNYLLNHIAELFGTNINWLSFKLLKDLKYYREKKYRVKVCIKWKEFLDFIEWYSKSDIELWRKYRYLTYCRQAFLEILTKSKGKVKDELNKVQSKVKEIVEDDLTEIISIFDLTLC